jgi:hypothetical protein
MKFFQAAAFAAAWTFLAGPAAAESTYGYASGGSGTVTATAHVNLSVSVAKLILLRVGSANGTVDTASWTFGASIPGVPTAPVSGNNNTAVNWDGTAPTLSATNPSALNVYAWTNATTPTINCAMGSWSATGGPANSDFTVTVTGTLPHPGANLGACASTSFSANTLVSGTWSYALGGTPASWKAGTYSNTITYTATGL